MADADDVLWGPPICKGYALPKTRETVNSNNSYLIVYVTFSVFTFPFDTVKILSFPPVP
jgi:hypothetical protein